MLDMQLIQKQTIQKQMASTSSTPRKQPDAKCLLIVSTSFPPGAWL